MNRLLLVPLATLGVALALAVPALANDKFTGLPLAPSVRDNAPVTLSAICYGSNHVRSSLFSWSTTTPASAIAGWYKNAMPGSKETQHQFKSGDFAITEYIVISGDGSSRVEVNDYHGKTIMRLARAQRPIDWGQDAQKNCQSTE
ncbi:MAG: hypothetical protein ABI431_06790 [Candidatus Tumulicola sp.]